MNSAVAAWAKIRKGLMGACQADMLLKLMETRYEAIDNDINPNMLTYNSVILAWVRSGIKYAYQKS
eukprot:953539-Ditylum_brightwellii.AAC.1